MRTGIAVRRRVQAHDPLLDFASESMAVYAEPIVTPSPWAMTQPPTYAIDTTSRVISFVLGFALASLIAWLGNIRGDEVALSARTESVAHAVTPVVTAAKEEKTPATAKATTPTPPAAAAPGPAAPAAIAAAPVAALVKPARLDLAAQPPVSRPAVSGYRGALALSSSPEGAQVVLNGKVVGETPVVLSDLPVGSRALIVRRAGYSSWSASVRIVANQRTTVRATLTPISGGG